MKRRLLPILMTLVLVCALPIWAAFVTSGDVTNPLVCTADAAEPPVPVKVSTADDLRAKITAGNSVKLTNSIDIDAVLHVTSTLTLDLNGCTLRMTGTGSVLKVSGRATLTIQDSSAAKSGTITGGNAVDGGGVYIDNNATLKMTGGCITGCHASYGGGGIRSSGNLYMSGTAKIEKCTSNWGSDDAIWNKEGVIYADGGTVDGMVNSQGTITCSNGTNANAATVFNKTVYLRGSNPTRCIEAGTYNGTVENTGSITGGTFYGTVRNQKNSMGLNITGSVTGGTFYGPIVNEVGPGQVTGGTFAVTFDRGDGTKTGPELVGYKGTVSRPPSDPEKSGHTFTGWYLDDEKYNFDTPVTAPLTLTAKWEKVPSSGGYYYYQPTTDTKTDDAKGSPKTADPGVALYAALSLLSLTGLTCTAKKR